MLYTMKDIPDIYFVKDGMLIGEDKTLKYFREGFDKNTYNIATIANIKDFALDEILIENAKLFDIYIKSLTIGYNDGKECVLWQVYPKASLTTMSRDVDRGEVLSDFTRVFESPSRSTIQTESLPECLKNR